MMQRDKPLKTVGLKIIMRLVEDFFRSVWITFFILKCLNTKFREPLLPIFSFQIILFNDIFINMFKTIGLTWLDQMRELSLSSNIIIIIIFLLYLSALIYTYIYIYIYTHTHQTYNYIFSHFKICYLKYDTKHIFCIITILNKCFYNTNKTNKVMAI